MQAVLQLLCQCHLLHLQVRILQAKKNPAFLQRLMKIDELFEPSTGAARLGEEVPLDGIGMCTNSIAFRVHLFKRVHKGRQPFLPRDDGTIVAI
jgi:hypothetical protein